MFYPANYNFCDHYLLASVEWLFSSLWVLFSFLFVNLVIFGWNKLWLLPYCIKELDTTERLIWSDPYKSSWTLFCDAVELLEFITLTSLGLFKFFFSLVWSSAESVADYSPLLRQDRSVYFAYELGVRSGLPNGNGHSSRPCVSSHRCSLSWSFPWPGVVSSNMCR